MYQQAKSEQYFSQFGYLSQKVLAAKKRRKFLQQKVAQSQAQLNYTKNKIDRINLRLVVQSVWHNNKEQARLFRKRLKEERYWSIQREHDRLEELRQNTSLIREARKLHTKQAKQLSNKSKSTEAKMTKSRRSEIMMKTIEEREKEKKNRFRFRQKQMLDELYRIQNIVSKDVQLRYLRSIDTHKKNAEQKLLRLENLKRIKQDIEVSGLQPRFETQ